jgi:nitrate/nitrite transporter NarK
MKKISLNAVLAGGITDLLVTNLLGIPFVAFVVVNAGLARLPKDQVQAALMSTIHANGALHAMQLLLGLIATGVGGYVAAWIAKHDAVLHGALASWTCVALGIYSMVSGDNSTPLAMTLGLMLASVICAAFGGYLRHPADSRTRIPV